MTAGLGCGEAVCVGVGRRIEPIDVAHRRPREDATPLTPNLDRNATLLLASIASPPSLCTRLDSYNPQQCRIPSRRSSTSRRTSSAKAPTLSTDAQSLTAKVRLSSLLLPCSRWCWQAEQTRHAPALVQEGIILPASSIPTNRSLSCFMSRLRTHQEYIQICRAVGMGFVVMGFIGYFVKLVRTHVSLTPQGLHRLQMPSRLVAASLRNRSTSQSTRS